MSANCRTVPVTARLKVMTVVGARPQFIKAAAVSRRLREVHHETLVHTGQHYDFDMSDIFFQELSLPAPDYNIGVGSGSHATQTAEIMLRLEPLLLEERPDALLVYGDTNSTVAAALTAVKLQIPVAHVEAGVRSNRLDVPEEINRVVTDHVSTVLFCPTRSAFFLLEREGLADRAHITGDVMLDIMLGSLERARKHSRILEELGVGSSEYVLATIHRPRNVDDPARLSEILSGLAACGRTVIFPMHPRTSGAMQRCELSYQNEPRGDVRIIPPASYLDMLVLEENASTIVTDSGGVQREAYNLGIPCITCDTKTEWVETVADGWNILVEANAKAIVRAIQEFHPQGPRANHFGDGHAAEAVVAGLAHIH